MNKLAPLSAIGRGLAAGALAIGAFRLFFRATARIGPRLPRRSVLPAGFGWSRRSERDGALLDYPAGLAWGGLYGLAREALPALGGPLGVFGSGTLAWLVDDLLIARALGRAPSPRKIALANHAYAAIAHIVLGAALVAGYEALRRARFERVEPPTFAPHLHGLATTASPLVP